MFTRTITKTKASTSIHWNPIVPVEQQAQLTSQARQLNAAGFVSQNTSVSSDGLVMTTVQQWATPEAYADYYSSNDKTIQDLKWRHNIDNSIVVTVSEFIV